MAHDHIYNYSGTEVYSNIYRDDEPHLYDLQASFSFLNTETQNLESTFILEDYYRDTTSLLQQSPHEVVTNEANTNQNSDTSYHGNKEATRDRARGKKNKREISNQRMAHIAVERNRRKLMNEHLSVLRSLMPKSYVQRCDQASIVGGAINFIRELEHRLCLQNFNAEPKENSLSQGDAFKLPQFSTGFSAVSENVEVNTVADIEVSIIESHASLKIRSRRKPKLLLNVISGLQSLGFIILHLNVSAASDFILYCFSIKMEDCCKLTSVADISTAVYNIVKIHHDS